MLEIVAEETGYPPDLLDMDLDLEADLGIDTVKQAEVFATIREAYGIERDDSLQAARLPDPQPRRRLRQRAHRARRGARRPSPCRARARAAPRRRPVRTGSRGGCRSPSLRPPLDRCVATGVELGEGSRVVLMPDRGGVGAALAKVLAQARRRGARGRRRAGQ